ncbi:unnamed protein product, partial [Notodromas monacha]
MKVCCVLIWGILCGSVTGLSGYGSNEGTNTCEPITITLCQNLKYNVTRMPGFLGHKSQDEADEEIMSYKPLVDTGCNENVRFFLCSLFAPMCSPDVSVTIPSCKSICLKFSFVDGFGVDKMEDSGARKILEWAEDYINTQTDVSQPVKIVDVASFDREIDVGVNYDLRLRLGFLLCPKFVLRGSASCKLDEKLPETLCDVGILEDSVSKEKEMTRLLCTNSSRPSKTYLSADASQVASSLPTPPSPSSSVTASEASSVCDEFDSVDIDEVLPSGWTRLHKA